MSARLLNKLDPHNEGSLYPTLAAATLALEAVLDRFRSQGCTVDVHPEDSVLIHTVRDASGAHVAQYYVE
jgi:hypothetical protein